MLGIFLLAVGVGLISSVFDDKIDPRSFW